MSYEKANLLSDLVAGHDVVLLATLKEGVIKVDKNGKPFLFGTIEGHSAQVPIRAWDYSGPVGTKVVPVGSIIKLQGTVSEYRDEVQINIDQVRIATDDDLASGAYRMEDMAPVAPDPYQDAYNDLMALVSTIEDDEYRTLCTHILTKKKKDFEKCPAAKSVHHAFIGGLAMHSLCIAQMADAIADQYPLLNRSLLLTGAALHDIGKLAEFERSNSGVVVDYTKLGNLVGHLVMGYDMITTVGRKMKMSEEKLILLQHLILSHHGTHDGSCRVPQTPEAYVLADLDNLDARLEMFRHHFDVESVEPGEFVRAPFGMEAPRLYRPNLGVAAEEVPNNA